MEASTKGPNIIPERQEIEKTFQEYMVNLGLKIEDISGKVLDIGAGEAFFAKYIEEHNLSKQIVSLDESTEGNFIHKKGAVRGSAELLPFKDGEFDIVISHASVPRALYLELTRENGEELKSKLFAVLKEMLRVVRPGGQVRFGPIAEGKSYKIFYDFKKILDEVLDELNKSDDVTATTVQLGEVEYINEVTGNLKDNESYMIISKLEKPKVEE